MTNDQDQWFWDLLARAGKDQRDRILASDEEFDKFMKENPLTPDEEKQVAASVERLRSRLLKTAEDFMKRDSSERTTS